MLAFDRQQDPGSFGKVPGIGIRPHRWGREPRDRREPVGSTSEEHCLHAIAVSHDGVVDNRQKLVHRPPVIVDLDRTAYKRRLDPDNIGGPKQQPRLVGGRQRLRAHCAADHLPPLPQTRLLPRLLPASTGCSPRHRHRSACSLLAAMPDRSSAPPMSPSRRRQFSSASPVCSRHGDGS